MQDSYGSLPARKPDFVEVRQIDQLSPGTGFVVLQNDAHDVKLLAFERFEALKTWIIANSKTNYKVMRVEMVEVKLDVTLKSPEKETLRRGGGGSGG